MKIFLDDVRNPVHAYSYTRNPIYNDMDWVIVRNYKDFCELIRRLWNDDRVFPELISFDHDLADEHYGDVGGYVNYDGYREKTGYSCAMWLAEFCTEKDIPCPNWLCHSMNPVGRDNINSVMENLRRIQDESRRQA